MNIGFDLDGVIYPWHTAVYNYLVENKQEPVPSFRELWLDPYSYLSEEKWDYLASLPTLYSVIMPRKSILDMLNELDKAGHTIYYITNREKDLHRITEKYLDDYKFPQASNLIMTKEKDKVVRTMELDVIVEDKPKNLEKLASLCRTIGIAHPWNEDQREYLESLGVLFVPSAESLREVL